MLIVIDIPEDLKKMIFDDEVFNIAHSYHLAMCVKKGIPLSNRGWVDILSKQFNISRRSAKEMLHLMMSVKMEDNFKSSLAEE